MIPTGCPETSVRNTHCTLCNNPEERRCHLLRGGSLQWWIKVVSAEKGELLSLVALASIWECLVVVLKILLETGPHSTAGISWHQWGKTPPPQGVGLDGCQECDIRCSVATVLVLTSSTRGHYTSYNTTECKLHTETLLSKRSRVYGFDSLPLAKLNLLRRVQIKRDGRRWRSGGEVKGKLANGVGSQYPSHYLGTRCIQH